VLETATITSILGGISRITLTGNMVQYGHSKILIPDGIARRFGGSPVKPAIRRLETTYSAE
ncbi:unnamed protein product, partial [marine sediment metagenome]